MFGIFKRGEAKQKKNWQSFFMITFVNKNIDIH